MSNSANPYLSIVASSRNDNHGGDMIKRMRVFVKGLVHQCNKYKLPCELLMVEWNPIQGEKLLHDILPSLNDGDFLSIRYIVVPPEIHQRLAFSDQLPLFQMIAKNVGIRRAAAEFVLCTNVDLLFSDDLFAKLARRELKPNYFYRANRCDIPNSIDENWTVDNQLKFCKANIKLRNGKNAFFPNFADTTGFMFKYPVFLPLLKFLAKVKATYANSTLDRFNELDLDACGDFTLMSKQNWLDIQGYPELEIYSIHIDSMGVIAAAAKGFKQIILSGDECTYHIEHTGGWDFKSPLDRLHFYTKFPMLDWWAVRQAGIYIIENKSNFNLNKANWGLTDVELQEISGKKNTA